MKKEFLDFLYEQRAKVQTEIDLLVEAGKKETPMQIEHLENPVKSELRAKREHIFGINKTIERYLELHSVND